MRPNPIPHTHTKNQVADKMTEAVTEAVLTIAEPGKPIDLHMVGDFWWDVVVWLGPERKTERRGERQIGQPILTLISLQSPRQ